MRCSSFRLALGAALVLPLATVAVAGECPLAAAKKAQAQTHAQPVAFKAEAKDIVDTAVSAGSFKTLVAAVQAAGLVDTLKGAGPFTVFAPTDEAFAKLPEGTVESLLKPENKDKLVAVLTYHVVPGKVMAADVVKLTEAPTVQGSKAKVKVVDGAVMIDAAKVVKTDIETSNGVIHVIDAVILPPQG
jgi:transforming growth factor-beta-induced protein